MHCASVAGATDVPVLLYDVPPGTGTALAPASLTQLAELPPGAVHQWFTARHSPAA